jgi:hypothetical protein
MKLFMQGLVVVLDGVRWNVDCQVHLHQRLSLFGTTLAKTSSGELGFSRIG